MTAANVTIIGGHGKIALLAAPLLVKAGHRVRSVVRNPDHVAEVETTGAEAVVLDVEQAGVPELTELLRDTDAVVWSAGAGGGNPARTYAVDRDAAVRSMEASEAAGVGRYVMVSYFGAGPDHGVPPDVPFFAYAEAKAAADAHLRGTGLAWTILGPSGLTLDEPTGAIEVDGEKGSVSRANVAAVIAAVLDRDDRAGRTVEFNDGGTPIEQALDADAPA
ncbi:MAG: NAD(P)H-binding protein [Marmoricola sp.]